MGQYFVIANLDKKEYIHPHRFEGTVDLSSGMKLWEICANSIAGVLPFLLRQSEGANYIGAGGDIKKEYKYAGRWRCDRIAVIGDYDEEMTETYTEIQLSRDGFDEDGYGKKGVDNGWTEISGEVALEYEDFMGIGYLSGGDQTPAIRPDLVIVARSKEG